MRKSKHTLKSFFIKSILFAVSAITITCIVVGIYSFSTIDGYINKIVENKLLDFAVSTAAFISGEEELFTLEPGQESDSTYQRCLAKLKEVRDATEIEYIYNSER